MLGGYRRTQHCMKSTSGGNTPSASLSRRFTSWRMLADTATVGGWTSLAKVAGAVKVILAARLFGTGDAMDAYLIAFLLPSFFIEMLSSPLDSALIPTLIEVPENKGRTAAESLSLSVHSPACIGIFG